MRVCVCVCGWHSSSLVGQQLGQLILQTGCQCVGKLNVEGDDQIAAPRWLLGHRQTQSVDPARCGGLDDLVVRIHLYPAALQRGHTDQCSAQGLLQTDLGCIL